MTARDKEKLLDDLLGGDEVANLRESTLAAGLCAIRWKRLRRRTAAYLSLLILPSALLLHSMRKPQPLTAEINPVPVVPKVEQISTEELFALFPNRPLALVGKPGSQQLVFLDQPQPTAQ